MRVVLNMQSDVLPAELVFPICSACSLFSWRSMSPSVRQTRAASHWQTCHGKEQCGLLIDTRLAFFALFCIFLFFSQLDEDYVNGARKWDAVMEGGVWEDDTCRNTSGRKEEELKGVETQINNGPTRKVWDQIIFYTISAGNLSINISLNLLLSDSMICQVCVHKFHFRPPWSNIMFSLPSNE